MPGTISTNRAPVLTLWAVVAAQRIGFRWDVSLSLGIDSSSIAVVSGHGSPAKIVAVDGMDDEAIRQAFPYEKPWKSSDKKGGNTGATRSDNSPVPCRRYGAGFCTAFDPWTASPSA